MEPTLQAITAAILPPLITAAVAALGIWLGERRKDRDEIQRRLRAIGEETAHLGYLKSWLEARRLAAGSDDTQIRTTGDEICAELIRSHERLVRSLEFLPEINAPSALRRTWEKTALVPLRRPAARAVGWVYRLCILLSVLAMTLFLSTDYSDTDGVTFGIVITTAVLFSVPFIAAALGFRAWALALERRTVPVRTPAAPLPTASPWFPPAQTAPQPADEVLPVVSLPGAPR